MGLEVSWTLDTLAWWHSCTKSQFKFKFKSWKEHSCTIILKPPPLIRKGLDRRSWSYGNKINIGIGKPLIVNCNIKLFIFVLLRKYKTATATSTTHSGAKLNLTKNCKSSPTKHTPNLSKWHLPEPCTILPVHRTEQPFWVLLGSKTQAWLCKSSLLYYDYAILWQHRSMDEGRWSQYD